MTVYDVIVIGARIEGTSTAYQLVSRGLNVIIIEQFPWPHSRGSSCGHSRQLRKNYSTHLTHHSKLTDLSRARWRNLEQETGINIYNEIGVLSFAFSHELMAKNEAALRKHGYSCESFTMDEVQKRYPMFKLPKTAVASLEKEAGILSSDNALRAFMTLFKRFGGILQDSQEVLDIKPGDVITVTTDKTSYRANQLVVTAGPWTNKLLAKIDLELPLQTKRIAVLYWREKQRGMFSYRNMPSFTFIDGYEDDRVFAIPSAEYPGHVKVCIHGGPDVDPDKRDVIPVNHDQIRAASNFVRKNLPDLEDVPSVVETCIYTMSPDEDFILDFHPNYNNIVIGAGFSGHGFKMAPMVGEMLSDLLQNKKPIMDMQKFAINRFHQKSKI